MGYVINILTDYLFIFVSIKEILIKNIFYIFVLIVFNYTSLKNEFNGTIIQLY